MIIKNSNTRRNLFENRYAILVVIFAIILAFFVIKQLNENSKEKLQVNTNSVQNNTTTQQVSTTNTSVLTGQTTSEKVQTSSTQIIEDFISYCNNGQIEQAYNLLTDDCKQEIFQNSEQLFQAKYVNKIFTTKKMVSIQSWYNYYGYTYRVKILDDMISTGKTSSSEDTIEDYYTIVQENSEYKLSINGYIGKSTINKTTQIDGITITVVSKNIYKEYEEYNIKIENTTTKTVCLDSQEKTDTIYLIGSNESHYNSYSYELDKNTLTVEPSKQKTITIRFNKIYSNQTEMEKICFTDIITDYEMYLNTQDKTQYQDIVQAYIEL
jgi:hypothetical protein